VIRVSVEEFEYSISGETILGRKGKRVWGRGMAELYNREFELKQLFQMVYHIPLTAKEMNLNKRLPGISSTGPAENMRA
jgi:hypothetical protein